VELGARFDDMDPYEKEYNDMMQAVCSLARAEGLEQIVREEERRRRGQAREM